MFYFIDVLCGIGICYLGVHALVININDSVGWLDLLVGSFFIMYGSIRWFVTNQEQNNEPPCSTTL